MSVQRNNSDNQPALAAIAVVPGEFEDFRSTISHLRAQSAAGQMEVVFVVPEPERFNLPQAELACFHSWQVVATGTFTSYAQGLAAGIRRARAAVVALCEDHSFPQPNWAEELLAAHHQPWAAVGPGVQNGNPDCLTSWADFYTAYNDWAPPISSGKMRHLPGHNCSYKREILLTYGERLEGMLQAESVLHRDLTAGGHELWLESGTYTSHLNFTARGHWLRVQYHTGRQFASTWAQPWPWPRRLLFTAAAPGIPALRLWRIQKRILAAHTVRFYLRLLPLLSAGLLLNGLGQMAGYATGAGDCIEKVTEYERHRFK